MHKYFKECPYCGSYLDPGEKCNCRNERRKQKQESNKADLFYDLLAEQHENSR